MDDLRYERELRAELAGLLDPVVGSHPRWDASPAAERVTGVPTRPWRSVRSALLCATLLGLLLVTLLASALFTGGQPTDDAKPSAWMGVEFPDGGGVSDVIETPIGYLAVGWAEPESEHGSVGAAWTSSDCFEWERVPMGEAAISRGLDTVAYVSGIYVTTTGGDPQPSLRLSRDGRQWERVVPGFIAADSIDGRQALNDLIAVDDRFVAIGGWGGAGPGLPSFWISTDGRSWHEVTDVDPVPTGLASTETGDNPWGWAFFDTGAALVASDSVLYAAGTSGRGEAVWRSTDAGSSWTRVLTDDQATFRVLTDIAVSPDGVVAAVGNGPFGGDPVVWWSADGTAWSMDSDTASFEASHGPAEYDGVTWLDPVVRLDSVAWAGARFFVLGNEGGPGAGVPVMWASLDGAAWTRQALDPAMVAAGPAGVFACGDQLLITASAHEPLTGWVRPVHSFEMAAD